jgi:hypothetical protein
MQGSLLAGGLRLCREGLELSGSLRKVSGYIPFSFPGLLLSEGGYARKPFGGLQAVLAYLARYTYVRHQRL